MFALRETTLLNNVTSEHLPLTPPSDPETALSILGANVDEDFLILLPSPDGDGSVLKVIHPPPTHTLYHTRIFQHLQLTSSGLHLMLSLRLQHFQKALPQAPRHPRPRPRLR